jgi:hypothetical protein
MTQLTVFDHPYGLSIADRAHVRLALAGLEPQNGWNANPFCRAR